MRYWKTLCIAAAAMLGVACQSLNAPDEFQIYLIRHAEKQTGGPDPELSAAGLARVERLRGWLASRSIDAVYSSDYRRTRDTAAPIAETHGLDLSLYDLQRLELLAERLVARRQHAVVIGHSNTTPALASLLSGQPAEPMDESVYNRSYIVHFDRDRVRMEVLNQDRLPVHR